MFSRCSFPRTAAVAALISAADCGFATEPMQAVGATPAAPATLPRPLTAGEQSLVSAANDFSFSLFRQLSAAQRDSNVFTSPLSASMALGMTMNGAAGTTYAQIRSTLGLGSASDVEIDDSYTSLIALLRGLDATTDLRIANSIWYRNDFPFNQSFLDAARQAFDAQISALDFASPAAVPTINTWVSAATLGRIPTIIDRIDADQVMLLINAISFKGSWRERFDSTLTTNAPFHGVAGDQTVKLMYRAGIMRYFASPAFEAVDLPYGNGAFTMTLALPRAGTSIDAVAGLLQAIAGSFWSSQLRDVPMQLFMPRFKLELGRTLNDDLTALGIRDAFVPNSADFSRMSPRGRALFLSAVQQRTYVDVNEEGTEAAAVTSVGVGVTSAPPFPLIMFVDRPFVFIIREQLSGTVIFMGKVVRLP